MLWLNSFIKEEYFLFKGMGMEKMADLGSCLESRSWNDIAVCLGSWTTWPATAFHCYLLSLKGLDSALDSVLHSDLSNLFCHQIKWGLMEILIYLSGILASKMFYFSVFTTWALIKIGTIIKLWKKIMLCLFRQAILSMKMSSIWEIISKYLSKELYRILIEGFYEILL